ncbi:MAG TPA: glucosamine-6-phosphate deaminase [Rhodothermales bacterium]|nr:glucosamine-6-phosphate deaminase [Rhodothermales bacterium]
MFDSENGTGGPTRMERVAVLIFEDPAQMAHRVAARISSLILEGRDENRLVVLGLPTGSTPIGVYQELIKLRQQNGLDFSNVVTFNLDEYYPMQPTNLQSYHRFMRENFFDHVNIPEDQIHIPDGSVAPGEVESHCQQYEAMIRSAGGIDLMLLGIGRSGHIGFNEPGSKMEDRTRLIVLDEITRKDAASDFFEERYVPRQAITMGVGTIMESREIILMATGEHKALIIRRAVEEPPNDIVSATYLQRHPNAAFYLDKPAASDLTRERTPWLVRAVDWDKQVTKKAVIWLSRLVKKAIQQLDAPDFHRHHLHELVYAWGNADELCRQVFEDLRGRVLYKNQLPVDTSIVVFSPHPDDDVISMGGMLKKLVENGNRLQVAYMTNGSVAVFDQDVRRHLRFVELANPLLEGLRSQDLLEERIDRILRYLDEKEPAQVDTDEVQALKAFIRYTEAISAVEVIGLDESDARFLDLPFYKTGRVKKDPIGDEDVRIIVDLLMERRPDHIFVAGDLSDPHGTHRMCYHAIRLALARYRKETGDAEKPLVWLYRGAWQEWEIDVADVFLPLSKADLTTKIEAIFKHESQKDRALFPGAYDDREFWQRARDRNCDTANALDELGLPEFYAAEAYVTVREMP